MFGFSLAELFLVLLIAIIFIKPQDLPEIAHFVGRLYYKARKLIDEIKMQLKKIEKEWGLSDIKDELNRGIADEKIKAETEIKKIHKIIDIYGNEHEVNAHEVRDDLSKDEIDAEIQKYNDLNQTNKISTKIEP